MWAERGETASVQFRFYGELTIGFPAESIQ